MMSLSRAHECRRCEELRSAAVDASKIYHALQAELEFAHISHQNERIVDLRQRRDAALLSRNSAIDELCAHEAHRQAKGAGA